MAATGIDPASKPRRSYVYRTLLSLGAECRPWRDGAMAMRLGRASTPRPAAGRRSAIADLSPLPRTGFKGAGTVDWLIEQGLAIGADSNMAYRQQRRLACRAPRAD